MSNEFQLRSTTAEAMIAQLCHDIAAPVSGVVTSSNLLFMPETSRETIEVARELLSSSVSELLERLTYIREMCALDHEIDFVDTSLTKHTCTKLLALKEIGYTSTDEGLTDSKIDADLNKILLWLVWFIYRSSIGTIAMKTHVQLKKDGLYRLQITAEGENFVFNEQKVKIMLDKSKDKMSHYNAEAFYIRSLLKEAKSVSIVETERKGIAIDLLYSGKVYV